MPLIYDKVPPTPDDVHLDPDCARSLNSDFASEDVDVMVAYSIGSQDAHRFAMDVELGADGLVQLGHVRRGLRNAASVLLQDVRIHYVKGVEDYIERNRQHALQSLDAAENA